MKGWLDNTAELFNAFARGFENPDYAEEAKARRRLGEIMSLDSIPAFARPGGAEPRPLEEIRRVQDTQLARLGTPEALNMIGRLSGLPSAPERTQALGYLSSALSQQYGLPAEQVNAMLMGGVEPGVLGSLFKKEPVDLVQTYDPATGQMVYTPKSQAAGKVASAPEAPKERRIIEQNKIQYYADTGEPVIKNPITTPENAKEFKQFELESASFASRMNGADAILSDISTQEGFSPIDAKVSAASLFGGAAERAASSPELQRYKNAAQEWIRAKLRKESGAVIGEDEMRQEYETYFPVLGDKPSVIKQKEKLREQATKGMITTSQGAFDTLYKKPANPTITPEDARAELKKRGAL